MFNHRGTEDTEKCKLRIIVWNLGFLCALCASVVNPAFSADNSPLLAGFGEADITPKLDGKPVYLAGLGANRKATGVLDPLVVRAIVLRHDGKTIAIACADVVGLFLPSIESVRKQLSGFDYVLVSSTHDHHGPDTMGLWGPIPSPAAIDPDYLRRVESAIVAAIRDAEKSLRPVTAQHRHAPPFRSCSTTADRRSSNTTNWRPCSFATRPTIGRRASSSNGTAIRRRSTARTRASVPISSARSSSN